MSLLLDIARCPIALHCISSGNHAHPCSAIVHSQPASAIEDFQLPEPWSGHLEAAPILFMSSNPSWSPNTSEQYPRVDWADQDIEDFFSHRFGGHEKSSIVDGIYDHLPGNPRPKRGVAFWISVRARAAELHQRSPRDMVGGEDYALTEVVRCKSANERGVAEALLTCADRYLEPTLNLSAARVVVFLGKHVQRQIAALYGFDTSQRCIGPVHLGGTERHLVFLPHPASFEKHKTFTGCLTEEQLAVLRRVVQA